LNITPETWAQAARETREDEARQDEELAQRIAAGLEKNPPPAAAPGPVDYMLNAYRGKGDQIPPAGLLAQYARGPAELEAAITGLTPEQLRATPIPGRWSTLQVVGHLADCEQFLADRMKRTIAMERPLLMGMDENKYMAAFDYHARDLQEELALIRLTRAQMVRLLTPLAPFEWSRQAVHSEAGLMTLHHIVFHATYHIQHHLRFIEEKRRSLLSGQ
jgi:uncharacterized damage-inducible protein DinB